MNAAISTSSRLFAASFLVALAAALAACSAPRLSEGNVPLTHDTALGKVLADSEGMTLYTYDEDESGLSHCSGMCAIVWPPVEAAKDAKPHDGFTIARRENGGPQWAWRDQPLYTYLFDSKPGDVKGDGEDGVWHVVKP